MVISDRLYIVGGADPFGDIGVSPLVGKAYRVHFTVEERKEKRKDLQKRLSNILGVGDLISPCSDSEAALKGYMIFWVR